MIQVPRFIRKKLANEILAICIIAVILPLAGLLGILYSIEKDSIVNTQLGALETIYNVKLNDIQLLTDKQKESAENLAALPYVKSAGERMSSSTFVVPKELDIYLGELVKNRRYYDIFLIDMSGNVKYSVKKKSDLGTNLVNGKYSTTGLAEAFKDSKLLVQSVIVPLEEYTPSGKPAGFVATPVLSNGKLVAILAAQLDQDDFFNAVKSFVGFGHTSEIVAGILRKDGNIVAAVPLKYAPKAFEQQLVLNKNQNATGMMKAARGGKGVGEILDYRGVQCFAIYGYVPSLRWGLVVKVDKVEVMEAVNQRLAFFMSMVILMLAILTISSIWLARYITSPISKLTSKVDEIVKGDFSIRIKSKREDEIGMLANSFNSMTEEIKIQLSALSEQARLLEEQSEEIEEHSAKLEETVKDRTYELNESKQKLERYVGVIDEHVITSTTDTIGIIIGASNAFCKISGYSKQELIGKSHNIVRHPDMPTSFYKNMWDNLLGNKSWSGEIKNIRKNGEAYWVRTNIEPLYDSNGKKIGYTAVREDITDKKIIEMLSITDELTKLYNRRYFNKILEQLCAPTNENTFAFLMFDVDNFKKYNDTYGHQKGDQALIFIGETVSAFVKSKSGYGFRLGGEEFGILIRCQDSEEASQRAEELRCSIQDGNIPHEQNPPKVLTVSIGVKFVALECMKNRITVDEIYKSCDEALYAAKETGRNKVILS